MRCVILALIATSCALASGATLAFDFSDVAQRAKQLAGKPFKDEEPKLPKELQSLTYQQYWDIRFKPERYQWRGAKVPFELAFFHQGLRFDRPVKINEVSSAGVRELKFNPDDFDYGANKIDPSKMRGLGFAGFRVHYPVNTSKYKDEVLSFLGASYFRALGKGQRYGLSARGLAIDTGLLSGEEFPRFVEFWIERPAPGDAELVIYGLLDSRRVTGAYRFVLKPGADTAMDVKARLYLREKVEKLGLAPLTSMFFLGENQRPTIEDYRPEVHDSDGLSIHSGTGEWIWRPLVNPRRLLITSFAMTDPRGFGLMQRDRAFSSYEEVYMRYELRPSAWVEPKGKWGAGRVELVQLPTPDETNDNIVAFWVPEQPPKEKQYDIEYRLLWQKDNETRAPLAWVMQTRRGRMYGGKPDSNITFVIDFIGPILKKLPANARVEGMISVDSNAELVDTNTYRNDATDGWRVMFRVRRIDDKKPVEMRGVLKSGNDTLSETWSYILPPI